MRVLISQSEIEQRVSQLGHELSRVYVGRPLTVVGVLSGSVLFVADLMRQISVPHRVGFLQASSYRGTSTGQLRVNPEFSPEVEGRDVLLIDDIFDTGQTLTRLLELVAAAHPASISTAVLLWKQGTQRVTLQPDYYGFKIPNEFVVGYGLDYNQDYRHLPYIGIWEPPAETQAE